MRSAMSRGVFLTGEKTIRLLRLSLTTPTIIFPEPEGHWHFKLRKFKERLQGIYQEAGFRVHVLLFGLKVE